MKKKKLYNRVNKEERKQQLTQDETRRITLSFYQYAHIGNPNVFRNHIYASWDELGVLGRVYVAGEGINAQISVPEENFDAFKNALDEIEFLKGVRLNIAIEDDGKSFYILKIKVRPKIVADGIEDESFDVTDKGEHVDAEMFNQLTDEKDTILIDMRNHYESEVGHFDGAYLPDVETFRESLPIIAKTFENDKGKKIVMYCTGGIRCEKASAFMKHKGFENVFQLEGGIIEYARQAKKQGLKNKFKGKNFVFDERMGERIGEEIVSKCHQCGDLCDSHVNCANDACHILFIQCTNCAAKYTNCCSLKCQDFNKLPEEERKEKRKTEVFNGTKFGKGRYKAHRSDHNLEE